MKVMKYLLIGLGLFGTLIAGKHKANKTNQEKQLSAMKREANGKNKKKKKATLNDVREEVQSLDARLAAIEKDVRMIKKEVSLQTKDLTRLATALETYIDQQQRAEESDDTQSDEQGSSRKLNKKH